MELYNSTNDTDLTTALANTTLITQAVLTYRYDFPSLDTYTEGFANADSITQIASNTFALREEANVISFPTEVTDEVWGGDLSVEGDLTAENLIVEIGRAHV